jgi:hypothetical protein
LAFSYLQWLQVTNLDEAIDEILGDSKVLRGIAFGEQIRGQG